MLENIRPPRTILEVDKLINFISYQLKTIDMLKNNEEKQLKFKNLLNSLSNLEKKQIRLKELISCILNQKEKEKQLEIQNLINNKLSDFIDKIRI